MRSPGESGAAAAERFQSAGCCQHCMGICNSELPKREAVISPGESGGAVFKMCCGQLKCGLCWSDSDGM